jgi:hypothetical protein
MLNVVFVGEMRAFKILLLQALTGWYSTALSVTAPQRPECGNNPFHYKCSDNVIHAGKLLGTLFK